MTDLELSGPASMWLAWVIIFFSLSVGALLWAVYVYPALVWVYKWLQEELYWLLRRERERVRGKSSPGYHRDNL